MVTTGLCATGTFGDSRLRDIDNYDSRFSISVCSGKMYGEVHIVMPVTRRKDSTCKETVDKVLLSVTVIRTYDCSKGVLT